MNYLTELTNSNKGLPPKTLGLAHRRDAEEINLNSFSITQDYIQPFVKALALNKKLQTLDLTQCSITGKMARKIIGNLPYCLEKLNFTKNPLISGDAERRTIKYLCSEILENGNYKLKTLILDGCNLGNVGAEYIADSLSDQFTVKFLDISNNNIHEAGAYKIGIMVAENRTIQVLFLHYNPLTPHGGMHIAGGLIHNTTLQVLDLSFCSMGKAPKGRKAKGQSETEAEAPRDDGNKKTAAAKEEPAKKKEEKEKPGQIVDAKEAELRK